VKLLFEIGTEELPPATVVPSLEHMAARFRNLTRAARLRHGHIETFGTPRRLAIRVDGLPEATLDYEETRVGPSVDVAFDANENPTKAALGFCRSQHISVDELIQVVTPKGEYVGARIVTPGRPTTSVLPEILLELMTSIPWPKAMHWGWEEASWGRPVHWIVAMLDAEPVALSFAGIESGKDTRGHRFHAPERVRIPTPNAYEAILDKAYVVPGVEDRRERILEMATAAAEPDRLVVDEALLDEVTQLVEYPQCTVGSFEERFLALPREVLISEMKEHQRYFAIEDTFGRLVNRFVVVYNTEVADPKLVARGNERVLAARLEDGAFFLDRDKRRTLLSRVYDLEQVVFLEGLGSMRDKTDRIVGLAAWLAALLWPGEARHARRAALLCKADLTTEMVGEFPELQGVVGAEYARNDGEPDEVAQAIYEHYMPRSAADGVPRSKAGVAVAIADKIDTITACLSLGLKPTGTADPFGLRRAALGIIRIILDHHISVSLLKLTEMAVRGLGKTERSEGEIVADVEALFQGRLRSFLSDIVQPDVVDAVLATGFDNIDASLAKVQALEAARSNADFESLAIAFKRVANILKNPPSGSVDPDLLVEDAEIDLWRTFNRTDDLVSAKVSLRDYRGALDALIALRKPIDRFFDDVLVMSKHANIRHNRLRLLRELRDLFETIGDISRIKPEER
jgi:glycyl-tRNA synthetase beta chain